MAHVGLAPADLFAAKDFERLHRGNIKELVDVYEGLPRRKRQSKRYAREENPGGYMANRSYIKRNIEFHGNTGIIPGNPRHIPLCYNYGGVRKSEFASRQ